MQLNFMMNLVWGAWLHDSYIVKVRYFFYNPFFFNNLQQRTSKLCLLSSFDEQAWFYKNYFMTLNWGTVLNCSRVWPHWPYIDKWLFLLPLCSKLKSGQIVYTVMMTKLCFTLLELIGRVTWAKTWLHVTSELSFLTYMYWTSGDQIKCSIHPKFNTTGIKSKHWEFNRPQQAIILYMWVQYKFNTSEEVDTNMSLLTGPEWSTVILRWPLRPVGFLLKYDPGRQMHTNCIRIAIGRLNESDMC